MFTEKRILSLMQLGLGLGFMLCSAIFLSANPTQKGEEMDWEFWKWIGAGICTILSYIHYRTAIILLR